MDFDENVELLRKARAGDMEAKNQIILQNSPLVKSIVKRYKNKGVEYDDLFQLGQLGMVKAMNNFDENFGVKFSTYAVPMIAGEIKRFLRDDGSIKVSRSIKNNFRAIQKHIDECRAAGLPSPSAKDLAQKFGIDEKELMFVMESWRMPVSLFDNADKNLDGASLLSREVSSGGTVQEHLIYFAVDQNDDGFVDRSEGAPVDKVRAKVITWCAGADGGLGDCSTDKRGKTSVNGRTVTNGDNVYSWQRAQEVR